MPHLKIDGHHIFYNDRGDGTPVVCLHNGFYSTRTWDGVREPLSAEYRVLDYDRYGFGRSDHFGATPTGDLLELGVRELAAFVDALALSRFHLVGHCLGGAIAVMYAARHPQRVLHLVAESVGYFGDMASLANPNRALVSAARVEEAIKRRMAEMHGEPYAETLWTRLTEMDDAYILSADYDIRGDLSRLQSPVFIINGDRDYYFQVDHALRIYEMLRETACLWIVPLCGHDVHHHVPDDFASNVVRFLGGGRQRG